MDTNQQLPRGFIIYSGTRSYRIEQKLGQGGFGITYLASFEEEKEQEVEIVNEITGNMGKIQKKQLKKVIFQNTYYVAIKEFFMKESCSRDGSTGVISFGNTNTKELLQSYKEKARKEAHILSRFEHPNIVPVLEIFEANNTVYSVMDYINGSDVRELINKNGRMSPEKAKKYALQICDALAAVHEKRILHLDIKPSNIMIDDMDNAKLMDFGISKQYDSKGDATSHTPIAKSAGYAPIEQYSTSASGVLQRFHPQTDTYSLGATIYAMLTGEQPLEATLRYHEELRSPINVNQYIDQRLSDIVMKAMSVEISKRYQTAEEMKKDLEKLIVTVDDGRTSFETKREEKIDTKRNVKIEAKHNEKRPGVEIKKKPASLKPLWITLGSLAGALALTLIIVLWTGNSGNSDAKKLARFTELVQQGDTASGKGEHEAALNAYSAAFAIDNSHADLSKKIEEKKQLLFEHYSKRAKEAYAFNDKSYYPMILSDCQKALSFSESEEIRELMKKMGGK